MNKLFKILFSPRTTLGLLVIFAIAMGVATFIENSYDTITAKILIYNALWFEVLMILMIVNFIGSIQRYHLLTWKKIPGFIFHFAFVVIIIGAGVTRYIGFEGMMHYYSQEKGVATVHQDEKMREITGMDVPTYWAFVLNDVKAVIEDSFNTTGKFGNLTTTEWVDEIMEFIDRNRFRNITSNIYRSIGIANDDYRTFAKGRPFNYVRIYNPTGGIRQEFKDNLYYDEPYIPTTRKIEILEEEKIEEVPVIPNKEEEVEEEPEEEKN